MSGAKMILDNRNGALMERFGFRVFTLLIVKMGQVTQTDGNSQTISPKNLLTYIESTLL